MKVFVLLAAACHLSQSAPQLLYAGYPYVHHAAAVVTGNSVPVAVGGYKAKAGDNGDLQGPVHEVPGLVPALAVHKQESDGAVSLETGTGALVHTPVISYYGKRSAEPQVVLPYAHAAYPYAAYPYAVPTVAVKPLTVNHEVVATGQAVPVAVGGYKAEAGDNGDLKGAVHEVPALFGAPALNKQENSNGGALTVGTSAYLKTTISKREAEADPAVLYSTVSVNHPAVTYTLPYAVSHAVPAATYTAAYHPYAAVYYG